MNDQNIYCNLVANIPSIPVESVYIFHQVAWVKTRDGIGVSSMAGNGHCPPSIHMGKYHQLNLNELAQLFLSDNYLEVAIGMAAINSYYNNIDKIQSNDLQLRTDFNAYDFLLQESHEKNVAVIGAFPFIEKLKPKLNLKNLWVFELNPTKDYHLPASSYHQYLPQADIVILTATTLLNRTFDKLLPHMKQSFNILTGPTTPMSNILFDYSISALSGMVITDEGQAFASFSQGAASKDAKGVMKVSLLNQRNQ